MEKERDRERVREREKEKDRDRENSIYKEFMYKSNREQDNGEVENNKYQLTSVLSSFVTGVEMVWLLFNERFSVWSRKELRQFRECT